MGPLHRRVLGVALLGALLAAASERAARASEAPAYDELPSGHVSTLPKGKRPSHISAREQVPGFHVAAPALAMHSPARGRHVSVVGDAALATQIRMGERSDADERAIGACFTDSPRGQRDDDDDPDSKEWTTDQMWQVNLWPKSKDNEDGGVSAVHREQLVEANGTATLESVDAWVDPATRGARLIARSSLPLVRVGRAIGGLAIYAGRDERPDGTRYVHYVAVRPAPSREVRLAEMTATRQDGGTANGSGCGHLRIPLALQANDGDTAILVAPVELPARPRAKGEVRTREMQVHLGVSQSSRDTQPRLSVSFGWSGREQVQRVSDD